MQIHLSALGCRLNEAELERWSAECATGGHQIVAEPADADVMVLNTCAVTQEAVRKSRKSIQRLHRQNPAAKVVVSGCYVSLADEAERATLGGNLGVDLIVTNQDKDQLVTLVEQQFGLHSMSEAATDPTATPLFPRNRQRAFIKIQDGCRYRCTFCIVTVARGDERSRTITSIVNEINDLHSSGVQEIVLTGVHVGGYGSDLDTDLFSLVTAILGDTDIPRIRFASVEPWDLPAGFFALFENRRLMPHMHLPLQSGCDTVLKRMARRCKTDDFSALVQQIRSAIPSFTITTDIIVGFPGETDDEWQRSLEYVESIGFGHIHTFSYSVREGTKAARFPNQVHRSIKRKRSQALHAVAAASKTRCLEASLGQIAEVLWERGRTDDGVTRYAGYTPNYLRAETIVRDGTRLDNAITRATLGGINESQDCLQATDLSMLTKPRAILVRTATPEREATVPFIPDQQVIQIKAVPPRINS